MKAAELMGKMSIHKIQKLAPLSFAILTINIILVFIEISQNMAIYEYKNLKEKDSSRSKKC